MFIKGVNIEGTVFMKPAVPGAWGGVEILRGKTEFVALAISFVKPIAFLLSSALIGQVALNRLRHTSRLPFNTFTFLPHNTPLFTDDTFSVCT